MVKREVKGLTSARKLGPRSPGQFTWNRRMLPVLEKTRKSVWYCVGNAKNVSKYFRPKHGFADNEGEFSCED